MSGPHGTSAQPTLTPPLTACLIVGVRGPPSFGPTNQAWYRFETSASRSWLTCVFVVNLPSNDVSLTLGHVAATSLAPWSAASQYVFAADAWNTATRIGLLPQCALALAPELVVSPLDRLDELEPEFDEPHAAKPTTSATVAKPIRTRPDRIRLSSRPLPRCAVTDATGPRSASRGGPRRAGGSARGGRRARRSPTATHTMTTTRAPGPRALPPAGRRRHPRR